MRHRGVLTALSALSTTAFMSQYGRALPLAASHEVSSLLLVFSKTKDDSQWCFHAKREVPPTPVAIESKMKPALQEMEAMCTSYLPRYNQHHPYEALHIWESTNCYNSLRAMNASTAHRAKRSKYKARLGVLEELIAVIVILGECVTLGAYFLDFIIVQIPGVAVSAVHNVLGLVIGRVSAAAHHLLFTGWYLQRFPTSNVFWLAPLLQIVLSLSTGILYASAMQHLSEVHYRWQRQIARLRWPPPARSY